RAGGAAAGERLGPSGLHERPRIASAGRVDREAAVLEDPRGPHEQRLPLRRLEELLQGLGEPRAEEAPHVAEQVAGNRLAAELPDDGPQLRLGVEGEGVVDRIDDAVLAEQAVAALAVGVVGDEVEDADGLEALAMRGGL